VYEVPDPTPACTQSTLVPPQTLLLPSWPIVVVAAPAGVPIPTANNAAEIAAMSPERHAVQTDFIGTSRTCPRPTQLEFGERYYLATANVALRDERRS
jgi:hypothetical protein